MGHPLSHPWVGTRRRSAGCGSRRWRKRGRLIHFSSWARVLQIYMDVEIPLSYVNPERWVAERERIRRQLEKFGLTYQVGGKMLGGNASLPTRSLDTLLKERDFVAIEAEFARALESVQVDPPAAVTAACAIIESLCKIYIADVGLEMPNKKDLRGVWKVVQDHLGLKPDVVEDNDLRGILTGLAAIVDGVSAFRTHVGTAHGRGRKIYRPAARHARLAIHAAHTLVHFLIETWDDRVKKETLAF
jgi:hypothetical protein